MLIYLQLGATWQSGGSCFSKEEEELFPATYIPLGGSPKLQAPGSLLLNTFS